MPLLRRVAVLLVVAFCSIAEAAPDATRPARKPLPPGVLADFDVKYVPDGDPSQTLDVYYPEKTADKPVPLLVWIHGGGWYSGSKAERPYVGRVNNGYIFASVEYRFSQKAVFPAQAQDCQAAIRWLRANAKKYNIDPNHIGVGGLSAGGHLVAILGVTGGKHIFPAIGGNEDQSDRVQAVCDLYGPTDFNTVYEQSHVKDGVKTMWSWNQGDPYSRLIGGKMGAGQNKQKCDEASPVNYVSKDNAPFLILHGDRDRAVPYEQSVELADLLTKAGVEVTLQRLPGSDHGGPAFNLMPVHYLVRDFFDKHLKGANVKIEALPESQVQLPPPQKKPVEAKKPGA